MDKKFFPLKCLFKLEFSENNWKFWKKLLARIFYVTDVKNKFWKNFLKIFFDFSNFYIFMAYPHVHPKTYVRLNVIAFIQPKWQELEKLFSQDWKIPQNQGGAPGPPPKGFRPEPFGVKPCLGVYNSTTLSRIRSVIWPNPETCCPSGKLSLKWTSKYYEYRYPN